MARRTEPTDSFGIDSSNRRTFIKTLGASVGSVGLAGCTGGDGDGDGGGDGNGGGEQTATPTGTPGNQVEQLTYLMNWVPKGQEAPALLASDKGWWAEEGLAVNVNRGFGSSQSSKEVAAGNADFAAVGAQGSIGIIEQGGDLIHVSTYSPRSLSSLFFWPDSGIEELSDIIGKKGAHFPGSTVPLVTQAIFNREYGTGEYDVVNDVDWTATYSLRELLIEEKVEVITDFATNFGVYWLNEDLDVPEFFQLGTFAPIHGTDIATRKTLLEEKPDVVRSFVKGLMRAYKYNIENGMSAWEETIDILLRLYPEQASGEGSREFHLMNLQLWLSNQLAIQKTREHGLGYITDERAETSAEIYGTVHDSDISGDELYALGDRPIESGELSISNYDEAWSNLETVNPGSHRNPIWEREQ